MELRRLVDVGVAALERGWLDPDGLTRAVQLFRTGMYTSPRDLWIESALLTAAQTDELYRVESDQAFDQALQAAPADEPAFEGTRYVVKETLNEGGMGRILVCVDRALGRRVALKALRDDMRSPEHSRLLACEARVTGNLEHPSIIPVYDVGVSDRDGPFYVMRLVDHRSLEHVLDGLRRGDPALVATWTLSRLLRTFVQVCQAIHYAHSRNVIHCDLKPANILLGAFGEVLVGDWGLAYARDQGMFATGGTPAYMAPEQIARTDTYDARTDVFALGVVLYRILSLRAPFSGADASDVLRQRAVDLSPELPSVVAPPDRPVPVELEEIAMQAMSPNPASRFESTQLLAAAVDAFLEGTRDREQRQRRADELVSDGDEMTARYREALDERPKLASDLASLAILIDPWESLEERRRVWDAEDEVAVFDALRMRILQEAIASYDQALIAQPGHAAARRGLARLYADQVERARERRSELDRIYFEGLLRQYDDEGILVRAGGRPGWLSVELTGHVDEIILATLEERDRQLVPGAERRLRRSGLETVPTAPGSYLLLLKIGDQRLRVPVLVRGDRETHVTIDLDTVGLPGDDEIFVAGGAASLGQELLGAVQRELRDVVVPPFFIQTFPVTFGSYLEFIEEVLADDPHNVTRLIPCAREGMPLWTIDNHRLVPTAAHGDFRMTAETWPQIPVFGIDALSIMEYIDWWSNRTGRVYRLPTEHEWEKAARGVDGRRFPWGDRFEAGFCKMRESRPGRPSPEPIGRFRCDVSPYGVRDMAGGIADWCTPVIPDGHKSEPSVSLASRGGAWSDSDADCAVAARRRFQIEERSTRLGFRLVRDAIARKK